MEKTISKNKKTDLNEGINLNEILERESNLYLFIKRSIDIICSLAGIIVLSPIFLIVSILIKIEDPKGRIIFCQERNGQHPKTFKMYKFRSMVHNAEELLKHLQEQNEQTGPAFKMTDDPRITKVGKFIRKTSLDELPQLFNVLKGDMSLVGPRPPIPREVEQYNSYQKQRLLVKPGLTCIWQVSGRNNIGFDEWVEMDLEYIKNYNEWMNNPYFDDETKQELKAIQNDEKEIEDRFYKELEFGTGGLRGVIGYGTNRINKYTVRKATFGLCNYILKKCKEYGQKRGVVIAYDSRHKSKEFCIEAAKTLAACGIKAYIYDSLRSTPQLSFSVRYLNCVAGIVITASHNPPEYNGYKVYWSDGGQVCPDIANEIIQEVNKIEDYSKIPTTKLGDNLIQVLNKDIDKAFINEVKKQIINQDVIDRVGDKIKIIYTPIHGTGNIPVREVLKQSGFKNVEVVKEQELPDSNFSTVEYPNPEEKAVFEIAIEMAKNSGADIIMGTDPDCDRVGVVVKNNEGEYVVLNGNQVGSLLVEYVISSNKENISNQVNPTIIKTIVTSELGAKIAKENGVDCIDTLTGFKFIGEKINQFEQNKDRTFVMGYEESYGYLVGTHARDKDGVVSALLISEMAAYYYDKGMTLYEGLQEVYKKYGYYKEDLKSITLKGIDGMKQIQNIMDYFRTSDIQTIADIKVAEVRDYKKGINDLPKSDVLKFILEDESWIAVRPSGTEAKIKFYFGCNGENQELVDDKLDLIMEYIIKRVNV